MEATALELDDSDLAVPMENEFYENIDSFLQKPAPTLNISKSNASIGKSTNNRIYLPTKTISDHRQPFAQKKNFAVEKPTFSVDLLNEAFAYSEKIAEDLRRMDDIDVPLPAISTNTTTKVRSAPGGSQPLAHQEGAKVRRNSMTQAMVPRKTNKGGAVTKLRSKVGRVVEKTDDFTVTAKVENDMKKNPIDFDSLLRNFETGATLTALRAELAQSKQSLASSESYIKSLSKDLVNVKR